jgi:osmotically-inducible protein OsmY
VRCIRVLTQAISLVPILFFVGGIACETRLSVQSQDDDRIARAVKQALVEDRQMNLVPIDVDVSERVVYLTGDVDTAQHKLRAEQIAQTVADVRRVVSKLRVRD